MVGGLCACINLQHLCRKAFQILITRYLHLIATSRVASVAACVTSQPPAEDALVGGTAFLHI